MLAEQPVGRRIVHYADILNLRKPHYRMHHDLRVRTQGDALLFPGDRLPLPDLWTAINGQERKLPKHHHDWALHKTWEWKDDLPARKDAWYGKLIRGKPAFVSLRDLPAIYALSSNYGELDDYLEAYADGLMSVECKTVYEALLREGPMPTSALRKAAGMAGGGDNARRFERAIADLQTDLKIVKCGVSDSNRWKYCYVYDVLLRWAPTLADESRKHTGRAAMRHIIGRYLHSSIAAPPHLFSRLFSWDQSVTARVVDEMAQDGYLEEIRVMGAPALTPRAKPSPEGEVWVRLPVD